MMKQLQQFEIITMGLKILLGFIGTLTLGIGGVGLMNIMLVSVTQRTREIGVEKALGGRRRDILFQFLAEALAITCGWRHRRNRSCLCGLDLAWDGLTFYSALAKNAEAADIRLIIDPTIVVVATIILGLCGPDQRHAARHQGLAPRSHRSPAVRIGRRLKRYDALASLTLRCTPSSRCRNAMISKRFCAWGFPLGPSMRIRLFDRSARARPRAWPGAPSP